MATGAGTGAFFLLRGGDGEDQEDPVGPFTFEVTNVREVSVDDTAPDEALTGAEEAVADLMSRYYTTAFVDPAAWADGTFPDLPAYFSGRASRRAERDLDDLSLGSEARNIERVEPSGGELSITFLTDPDRQPYGAVALTTFTAGGRAVGGDPLRVEHGGRYVLRVVEGEWRIVGYEVEGDLSSGSAGPGPSPEPGASP